jgi:serine/threonine protein kinase
MLNQQIHNYKIISLLGEGGMANVYFAQHQSLGNNVAIKLLKDEFVQHPNIRKRFLAEARNLAMMQHPNVIKVTDLIDAGDIVAFVMEYVAGDSLEEYISKNAPLANDVIKNLFHQMIDAIEYVHSQGLIHRDIKPSNFMVTQEGSIKLLDFGIAKNLNDGAVDYTKTSMAQQMGTPMYMSPEQVRNTAEITEKSDIYSLGVVLWQMVMNKKPYDSVEFSLPEIQVSILKESLPLTHTIWDSTIQVATEKDPTKRFLKINSKKDVESKTVSNTEIDHAILKQIPKKEKREKITYFSFKTISIGIGILLFVGILIFNLSNDGTADKSVKTIPDDKNPEIVVSTETADVPVSKKEESKKLPDEKTTNQNSPMVIKEDKEEIVAIKKTEYDFVRVGDLDVMKNDFGTMTWYEANRKLQEIGDGWRLPTAQEMAILLYENKNSIGGFYGKYYWTSTTAENVAFAVESRNITMTSYEKGTVYSVRMVKSKK